MMAQYLPNLLLWLFVINHGIAFGAGLYEQRIIRPQWFIGSSDSRLRVNIEAMRSTDTGRRFWTFVTTGPTHHPDAGELGGGLAISRAKT